MSGESLIVLAQVNKKNIGFVIEPSTFKKHGAG